MREFRIEQESRGNIQLIHLQGSLDMYSFPRLESQLQTLFQQGRYYVMLDCSQLDYIGSAGLGPLWHQRQCGLPWFHRDRCAVPVEQRGTKGYGDANSHAAPWPARRGRGGSAFPGFCRCQLHYGLRAQG